MSQRGGGGGGGRGGRKDQTEFVPNTKIRERGSVRGG